MTLTQYRNARRALHLAGVTHRDLSKDDWLASVRSLVRQQTSSTIFRPTHSGQMRRLETTFASLRAAQARERSLASPSEIERAEALRDAVEDYCVVCGGARFVGRRLKPGEPAVAVPCQACTTLEERSARAGIPRRYRAATIESFVPRPGKEQALEFAKDWDGKRSVVLTGDVGRGKTHLGCGLLIHAMEAALPAKFVPVAWLMDELKARFDGDREQSQAFFDRIAREHVLMLDDLGKEQDTDWTRERVSRMLGQRYDSELPTIVTTNLTLKNISDRYGAHLADRLLTWSWVVVGGTSMRRELAVGS